MQCKICYSTLVKDISYTLFYKQLDTGRALEVAYILGYFRAQSCLTVAQQFRGISNLTQAEPECFKRNRNKNCKFLTNVHIKMAYGQTSQPWKLLILLDSPGLVAYQPVAYKKKCTICTCSVLRDPCFQSHILYTISQYIQF